LHSGAHADEGAVFNGTALQYSTLRNGDLSASLERQKKQATCSMTTLEPMDTEDGSNAETKLLSNMFVFDPTMTLPECELKTTRHKVHFMGARADT
jgi:hypothetical protein